VVEGLARRNHSNRFRLRRDAGANSSRVAIPWKIRFGLDKPKPLLIKQEGAFLFPKERRWKRWIGKAIWAKKIWRCVIFSNQPEKSILLSNGLQVSIQTGE